MMFIVINAIVSAMLFVLVVVPPIFIYRLGRDAKESLGPPSAGEVIPGDDVSRAVKQKIYLIFVIPGCALLNGAFLYFSHYSPIRYAQYRVEMNIMHLIQARMATQRRLRMSGYQALAPSNSTFTFPGKPYNNRSFISHPKSPPSVSKATTAREGQADAAEVDGSTVVVQTQKDLSEWERTEGLRRRVRPSDVQKDTYVRCSFFIEIRALQRVLEEKFFGPVAAAEKNLDHAIARVLGEAPPGVEPSLFMSAATTPLLPVTYSSSRGGPWFSASHGNRRGSAATAAPAAVSSSYEQLGSDTNAKGMRRDHSVVLLLSDRVGTRRPSHGAFLRQGFDAADKDDGGVMDGSPSGTPSPGQLESFSSTSPADVPILAPVKAPDDAGASVESVVVDEGDERRSKHASGASHRP